MALVKPLSPDANEEVAELAKFFNETLGFCPNSVLTMQIRPAVAKAFIDLNECHVWYNNFWQSIGSHYS